MTNPTRPGQKTFWEDWQRAKDLASNYVEGVSSGRWATPGQVSTDAGYDPIRGRIQDTTKALEAVRPTFGTDWDVEGFKQSLREGKPFHAASRLAVGTAGAALDAIDPGSGHALIATSKPILASFLGASALTADKHALALAQDMLARGEPLDAIRRATGWEQGADKRWRFEISDKEAKLKPGGFAKPDATLGDVLEHERLYEAYPQLRDVEVTTRGIPGRAHGSYSARTGPDDPGLIRVAPGTAERMRSTLLHEGAAHGVQDIEDFAKGGNSTFLKPGTPSWNLYQERLKAIYNPMPKEEFMKGPGAGGDFTYEEYLKQHKAALKNPDLGLDRAAQDYAVQQGYLRQAGEVEARNVQRRADMTDEELAAQPSWTTEDVPREQQFVTMRRGTEPVESRTSGDDPHWSDLSKVRSPIPYGEMTAGITPTQTLQPRKVITPEEMEGGVVIPVVGDRTATGGVLHSINEQPLAWGVPLEGGPDFMRTGQNWASEQAQVSALARRVRQAQETGRPVFTVYSGMGARAGDFSHHNADALVAQIPGSKITQVDLAALDKRMREKYPQFAGVRRPDKLHEQLYEPGAGGMRTDLVKEIDKTRWQSKGFPSVAATRWATTVPELRDDPTGMAGHAITRFDAPPKVMPNPQFPHSTYPSQIGGGQYVGGFGRQIPRDLLWRDWANQRIAQGGKVSGPEADRSFGWTDVSQVADPQWVDTQMNYLRQLYGGQ